VHETIEDHWSQFSATAYPDGDEDPNARRLFFLGAFTCYSIIASAMYSGEEGKAAMLTLLSSMQDFQVSTIESLYPAPKEFH
jgi:hypothetical protein